MPKPMRAIEYGKKDLWKSDISFNVDYSPPIYSRDKYFSETDKEKYNKFLTKINGKMTVSISYKFKDFKDTFIFVLSNYIGENELIKMHPALHNIAIYYYSLEISFKHYFKLPFDFEQSYLHSDKAYIFEAFSDLISEYNLTKTQSLYLLPLALHMPLNYVADIFHRSRRTVEKNIDDIRERLNIETKLNLCQFLSTYYIMKSSDASQKMQPIIKIYLLETKCIIKTKVYYQLKIYISKNR
ncbi:helix-turn-helix transcriptional regulator [Piscirickettsia litoralis]|nr:hypothetical protein [Piscirickettsia litoralis]